MPLRAHSSLPEATLLLSHQLWGLGVSQMHHLASLQWWVGAQEEPLGCWGAVGRRPMRSIWQTTALLRSYVAETKSAVPNSLLDTITFIIHSSL